MATQTHTVRSGETLSHIAKRFNTTTDKIAGFRSGNPNMIFPGEQLTINTPDQPASVAPAPTTPAPAPVAPASQAPFAPAAPVPNQQQVAPVQAPIQAQQAPAPAQAPAPSPPTRPVERPDDAEVGDLPEGQFRTPSGAIVDESGALIEPPEETPQIIKRFGLSGDDLSSAFSADPISTISQLTQRITEMLGITDVRGNISTITKEIESIENERDEEIEKINDNPFISSGTKQARIGVIQDRYEKRISNRVNRLTLEQQAYGEARDQARFALSTAIGLYDKERSFRAEQIEDILDAEEKAAEAKAKLEPLRVESVGGFKVLRDVTGKVISTKAPAGDLGSGGGISKTTSRIIDGFGSVKDLPASEKSKTLNQLHDLGYSSKTPPDWFRELKERERRMSIVPEELQNLWDVEKARIVGGGGGGSGGLSFDDF